MARLTLDDLLKIGEGTAVRQFYLPIDESAEGFDPHWLRSIINGPGDEHARLQALRTHPYVRAGNIIHAPLDRLGLHILFYVDDQGNPLTRFRELIFTPGDFVLRVPQLGIGAINELKMELSRPANKGYGSDIINPLLSEITDLGGFKVVYFGPEDMTLKNQVKATKTFIYEGYEAVLGYYASVGASGRINNFEITFNIFSDPTQPADFTTRITVRDEGGTYVPEAEVRIKSQRAIEYGVHDGLMTYHFDRNGTFDSIGYNGASHYADSRERIERAEALLNRIVGAGWTTSSGYCVMLTDHPPSGALVAVASTGAHNLELIRLNRGDLVVGQDFELMPVNALGDLPGLQSDMHAIERYRFFTGEFQRLGLFNYCSPQTFNFDYVAAIQTLAHFHQDDLLQLVD